MDHTMAETVSTRESFLGGESLTAAGHSTARAASTGAEHANAPSAGPTNRNNLQEKLKITVGKHADTQENRRANRLCMDRGDLWRVHRLKANPAC